jgi:hypothetical protein
VLSHPPCRDAPDCPDIQALWEMITGSAANFHDGASSTECQDMNFQENRARFSEKFLRTAFKSA